MKIKFFLNFLIIFLVFVNLAQAKRIKIFSVKKIEEKKPSFSFKSDVSKRNLLGLERVHPYGLPILSKKKPEPKRIKILAIRVQFQKEAPDDPTTTGNGWFDLKSYQQFYDSAHHIIDPAPHNRAYFEAHLKALANYWWIVSKGKVLIDSFDVYPKGDTAYTLPYTMSHYGSIDSAPDPFNFPVDQLDSFFRHSFKLADTSSLDQIDFSLYKSFVLFHAGSDRQHDLGGWGPEPTPSDLFACFIALGEPLLVGERPDTIWDGLIIPETCSQDNRITALNAIFAHEFGHQLGLVDLYNTQTFITQVGDFSLMDNNAQNIGVEGLDSCFTYPTGILPVYPDAWSKAFLGFISPVEKRNKEHIRLFASELLTDEIQMIKVPINSFEYFLIENRQIDLDGLPYPWLDRDSLSGVFLGLSDTTHNNQREYDYLLPGSGILIWHVDEEVASLDYDGDGIDNFSENQLQLDKDRRFIALEEADGIIDFGGNYYTGFGLQEDMYYRGNNSSFTPYTYPSTRSNNKSNTHIWVTNIGLSDKIMDLDIKNEWDQPGWPQVAVPIKQVSSLVFANIEKDGFPEIFAVSGNFIYAWRADGSGLIENPDSVEIMGLNGEITRFPLATFDELNTTIVGQPSLGDLDDDDTLEVVAGTEDGRLYAWKPRDENQDGKADLLSGFPVKVGMKVSMTPVIDDFDEDSSGLEIYVGTEEGVLTLISSNGSKIHSENYFEKIVGLATTDSSLVNFVVTESEIEGHIRRTDSGDKVTLPSSNNSYPVVGDLDRDGSLDVIVVGGDSKIYALDKELNLLSGFPVETNDKKLSSPCLGDIDGNGYLEIVTCGENKIFAYNFNGTPTENFPIVLDKGVFTPSSELLVSSPILTDVDIDGYIDVIVGTSDYKVVAYNRFGEKISGFPLCCGGKVNRTCIFLNLDDDDKAELLASSDDGFIYVWELPWDYQDENNFWAMEGFDPGHTKSYPTEFLPDTLEFEFMPRDLVYVYPNPAKEKAIIRYFLGKEAQIDIKIYDLAGDLVDKLFDFGEANISNETIWDCSKFASGVYLCRVEAKAENEKKVVFCKLALVK